MININNKILHILAIKSTTIILNFAFYTLIAKNLPQNESSFFFLQLTIATAIEMFITGASESQILQNMFSQYGYKIFKYRITFSTIAVVIALLLNYNYFMLLHAPLNAATRLKNAISRESKEQLSIFFDGWIQSILNIIIALILLNFFNNKCLTLTPIITSIATYFSAILFLKSEIKFYKNTQQNIIADLAVYTQFTNSSLISISVGYIAGNNFKDLFLAQRFGDTIINISRVLQWTRVEKIKNGVHIINFEKKEKITILLATITCIFSGIIYGIISNTAIIYFVFLLAFTFHSTLSVLLANLTQFMIAKKSEYSLLKIRLLQLSSILSGIILAKLSHEPLIILATSASSQLATISYTRNENTNSKIK